MSDEENTSGQEEPEKKKLKGFANPENRKNILRTGRPKGAKNKVMSDEDFAKAVMAKDSEALERLTKIMREGTENNAIKAAFKILDMSVSIREKGGKLTVDKTDKEGKKESFEVEEEQEQKANGTTGKVVSFRKLVSTEYKDPDDKEQEKSDKDSD